MALRFRDLRLWIGHLDFCPTRSAPPLRGGRRIDFPKGDHRRPPAFFSFCGLGQGLWDSSISAILRFVDAFWSHALNFVKFPKTAAEPGASEKPCGRLGKLLAPLGRVLSPRDRLWRSLPALLEPPGAFLGVSWGSWGTPEGFLGPLGRLLDPLGPSWRRSKTRQK